MVASFTLSDLLGKPWSQVSSLPSPPPVRAFLFIAHGVQRSHCWSIFVECITTRYIPGITHTRSSRFPRTRYLAQRINSYARNATSQSMLWCTWPSISGLFHLKINKISTTSSFKTQLTAHCSEKLVRTQLWLPLLLRVSTGSCAAAAAPATAAAGRPGVGGNRRSPRSSRPG